MKKNYKSPVSDFVEIEIDSVMNPASGIGGGGTSTEVAGPNSEPFDAANNRGFGNLWENR